MGDEFDSFVSKLRMRKILIYFVSSLILVSTSFTVPGFAAVACSDSWNIPLTRGDISLLDAQSIPADFSLTNKVPLSKLQKSMDIGQSYLLLKNYVTPLPPSYAQKISEGGSDISVTGQWKRSKDGKNWQGFAGVRGDLLPIVSPLPLQGVNSAINAMDRVFSIADASRMGLTPNTSVAFEIKIEIKGCKPRVIYENLSVVPEYSISTRSLDSIIEAYYSVNQSAQKLNYIAQESCNQTLKTFISHVKDISGKNQTWTIRNTKRGTLDLSWSLTESENLTCAGGGSLPGFPLHLTPSYGDSCITLTTPFKSVYTYKTIKFPCSVSIDLEINDEGGSLEVAKFQIPKLNGLANNKSTVKTITCTNGKLQKKISSAKPQCPKGYRAK
jgi:hypothetical protein